MDEVEEFPYIEEYRRNPKLQKDVEYLKEWFLKQPHFPKKIGEKFLIVYLHSNYYRLEAAKTTIENYLMCRTHMSEFFSNGDIVGSKDLRQIMDTIMVVPLKQKTPEGYGVIYTRLINLDPERFCFRLIAQLYDLVGELWLLENDTMNGHLMVLDITGIQMSHAIRLSPMDIKKYLFYLQEATALRIKGLHFVNTTSIMDFLLGLIKPFLKKELMDLVYLNPTYESLSKHIPLEILPNEVGGKAGRCDELYAEVLRNLEHHQNYFMSTAMMRIDESKRPGKPRNAIDLFGVDGSFKKIDID